MSFSRQLLAATRLLVVMTVLLGVLYPAAVWAVGAVAVPGRAEGSLVTRDGEVVGSRLLGQQVEDPALFHSRPSTNAYAGDSSGGSNLAATAPDQVSAVEERRAAYATIAEGEPTADALTASASGLDPHISPEFARAQVARVARENGLERSEVQRLVEQYTQDRDFGFLGEPRVNVLELNLALTGMR
ncbi:K+-transporting ATPase ATPase C chain [Knoellia remsis]|uniref:Potassium-transporting ATPase KdpC subunit n=1 Tax=Knoellia remsis TaxID=407159 RepID=A0A2T0UA00_9MICO|nr:potassium-transporting ATPase subunit KdpC [Knoellia remsis]PRY54702.1 K+-transporting ATPase ATPase C chain [Knoellia remsis]